MTNHNTVVTEANHMIDLTVSIVSSALHNQQQQASAADISSLLISTFSTLNSLSNNAIAPVVEKQEPAVSIRASVKQDYIVCLEDGRQMKMLKRYIATHFSMTPNEYRAKWGLPADYPMVAPNYSAKRRQLAQAIGLGRRGGRKAAAPAVASPTVAKRRKAVAA